MKNSAYVIVLFLASACSKPEAADTIENTGTAGAALKVADDKPGTPAQNCKKGDGDDDDGNGTVKVSAEGAPSRGPRDAPVEIVFFSDYECPYCERAEGTLKEIEAQRPGKVKIVYRQRPLPFHEHAALAAKASLAAERQGRFWQYHDVLVTHRKALERAELVQYAKDIGLDPVRFERDLDDATLDEKVAAEGKRAEELDVRGTPTSFINGHRLTGAQPIGTWLKMVDAALAPSK